VTVRARGEPASGSKRREIPEVARELLFRHAPDAELANARSVAEITAPLERMKLEMARRMRSFPRSRAHAPHGQLEPRLHERDERTLAAPRGPREYRELSRERAGQIVDAFRRACAREHAAVPHLPVGRKRTIDARRSVREIHLVDADNGFHRPACRRYEHTVEEAQVQRGLPRREHEDRLIHVCAENPVSLSLGRIGSRENRLPGFDLDDHSLRFCGAAAPLDPDEDGVADDGEDLFGGASDAKPPPEGAAQLAGAAFDEESGTFSAPDEPPNGFHCLPDGRIARFDR